MDIKNILNLAKTKGYQVHNKRCEGNPLYTHEDTRRKDAIQEIALLREWLVHNHRIYIRITAIIPDTWHWKIQNLNTLENIKGWSNFADTWDKAIKNALYYTLMKLI